MSTSLSSKARTQNVSQETGRRCSKQSGQDHPCTCAMGNVSRFIEPVVLRILKEKRKSYGYEIAECLPRYALTDATIEGAALYRTLRALEANGHVSSTWDAGEGPARRNYSLTRSGHLHLREWACLLEGLGKAMIEFAKETKHDKDDRN
ncbi:MAG: helix-turn-helix transcriptional regulator [Terracidiphilus sp.]